MAPSAFSSHNVSVWVLVRDGASEYVADHNVTIKEVNKVDSPGKRSNRLANVGFHSEPLVGERLRTRRDVLSGLTQVHAIFTERMPCFDCNAFLKTYYPGVPIYFYLNHDHEWHDLHGGRGQFLMQQYGLFANRQAVSG